MAPCVIRRVPSRRWNSGAPPGRALRIGRAGGGLGCGRARRRYAAVQELLVQLGELSLLGAVGGGFHQIQHQRFAVRRPCNSARRLGVTLLEPLGAGRGREQRQIGDAALALGLHALIDAVLAQPLQLQALVLLALGLGAVRRLLALPVQKLLVAFALLLAALRIVALAIVLADRAALFRAIAQQAGHPVVGQLAPAAEPTRLL